MLMHTHTHTHIYIYIYIYIYNIYIYIYIYIYNIGMISMNTCQNCKKIYVNVRNVLGLEKQEN